MNLRKRIERLEARRPVHDPRLDALFWRMLATVGPEDERRALIDHAEAVEAGRAHGDPPVPIGFLQGIRGVGPSKWVPTQHSLATE